ncbi:MAG: phospholipase D-like domain-containing protein, partial [Rhabdochlamydiaceae bacterium]
TAYGASKKAVQKLSSAGIEIFLSSGLPLLHHKWAYIDHKELILGSTNWTEAAFRKNEDVLLFLKPLSKPVQSQIESIISAIQMESNKLL